MYDFNDREAVKTPPIGKRLLFGRRILSTCDDLNCVQNQAPKGNSLIGNSCQVEFQFAKSAIIIRFQILCSISLPSMAVLVAK